MLKPNITFFIKVDAKIAHERKNELPVRSIEEINIAYGKLSKQLKNFKIISNVNFDKAQKDLTKNYIIYISERVVI